MQNATVRARDAFRRLRPDRSPSTFPAATALRARAVLLGRTVISRIDALGTPAAPSVISHGAHRLTRRERLALRLGLTPARGAALRARFAGRERLLPIGVALLVLVGSLSAIALPATAGAVGGTSGAGDAPRLAVAGLENGGEGYDSGIGVDGAIGAIDAAGAARLDLAGDEVPDAPEGPYLADGTLLKPIAVDTSIADASESLRTYRVRSGDTLTGIARHFGVSMMTVWWANHLKSKDDLKVGQKLVIPPVDGTVHIVKAGETLAKIADTANVSADDIVSFNGLASDRLAVGQTLILPGGHGKPIPTPKAAPHPVYSSGGGGSAPVHYGGGAFAWPLPGGTKEEKCYDCVSARRMFCRTTPSRCHTERQGRGVVEHSCRLTRACTMSKFPIESGEHGVRAVVRHSEIGKRTLVFGFREELDGFGNIFFAARSSV